MGRINNQNNQRYQQDTEDTTPSEKEKEAIFLNLWLFGVDLNRSIENSKSNDLFTGVIAFSFAHCEWASIGLNKANLSL